MDRNLEMVSPTSGLIKIPIEKIGYTIPEIPETEWFTYKDGRILIEVRNPQKLKDREGLIEASDFDDSVFSASSWHKEEFMRLETDSGLQQRGIHFEGGRAKEIYERSKVTLPGITEPRYTPRLNLILASAYATALEQGQPQEQAWEHTLRTANQIKDQITENGEIVFDNYAIDPDILKLLSSNHTKNFVYQDFSTDFIEGTDKSDIRVIMTRGKIEGPLGQIHKVHSSGLLDSQNEHSNTVDVVIYTNDLKAETLELLALMFPKNARQGIRVYDDNPKEIDTFIQWAREHGITNLEVIRIMHDDAKRKDFKVSSTIEPVDRTKASPQNQTTTYETYFPHGDQSKVYARI